MRTRVVVRKSGAVIVTNLPPHPPRRPKFPPRQPPPDTLASGLTPQAIRAFRLFVEQGREQAKAD